MYFAKRMLAQNYPLPVPFEKPASYTSSLVASVYGASHKIYEVPPEAGGWYLVKVAGASGFRGHDQDGATSGGVNAIVYIFGGSKVLLWAGTTGTGSGSGNFAGGTTGYPSPSGQGGTSEGTAGSAGILGGGGAGGSAFRGGGGGGGAAGNGGTSGYKAGGGGAGSGCIIGVLGNAASTIGIHTVQPWAVGTYKVDAVTAMVLGAGGGGGYGDSTARSGGAGGGAWGNGGANNTTGAAGGSGPGGSSFGVGQATSGVTGGNAGYGAWCVRDFTTGTMKSGIGGGVTPNWGGVNGYVELYRLNVPTGTTTYRLRIVFEPRDIETRAEFMVNGDITPGCELDTFNTTEHWVTPNSLGGGTVAVGGSLLIKVYDAYGEHTLDTIDLTSAVISGGITVHANNTVSYSNSQINQPELLYSNTTAGAFNYTVPEDAANVMIEIGGGKGGAASIAGTTFGSGGFGELVRVYEANVFAMAGKTITGVIGGNGGTPTAGSGAPAGSAGGASTVGGSAVRGGGGGGATSATIDTETFIASGGGGATLNGYYSGYYHITGGTGGGPNGGAPGASQDVSTIGGTNGGAATGAFVSTASTGYIKVWKNYK